MESLDGFFFERDTYALVSILRRAGGSSKRGCRHNEVGAATCMKIFGVEILNEGSGVSIDDAVTEMQATFVARYVEPWQAVMAKDFGLGVGGEDLTSTAKA